MKSDVAGLIFDLDGTLVVTEPLYAEAVSQVARESGIALLPEEYLARFAGQPLSTVFANLVPWADVREATVRARELFWRRAHRLALTPGAEELLWELADHPRAVATNADYFTAARLLASVGMTDHFTAVVTMDDVGRNRHKPEPDLFLLAAERLNADPARCVVFEDSPVGMEAGRRAGMRVVYVSASRGERGSRRRVLQVKDFRDARLRPWLFGRDESSGE